MILLDTNVVSELCRVHVGKADPNVARWAERLDIATLWISVITVHELELGVLMAERRDAAQGATLRLWLETRVVPTFAARLLPIDTAIARRAARLHVPNPQPINDACIAATAFVHGLTLATRNLADFTGAGIRLLDPWQAGAGPATG